jgi:hypothetical protein
MTYPTVIAESSTRFKASSSQQVTVKPSPAAFKSPQGYRDFRTQIVILIDCFIMVRIIS